MKPYFSIIMPTYNRAALITEAIQSLIDQTFKDWELIIIDDHGNDNTKEIIKNIKDPRISYSYLTTNHGPGAARDIGIKKAKADIIVLADSDDVNYPERLQLTYEVFKKNKNVDLVYGLAKRLESDGRETLRPSQPFDAKLFSCYNFIAHITVAFKKNIYLSTRGYDRNLRTSEDYNLLLTLSERNCKFYFINKPLVLQKIHSDSTLISTDFNKRKNNLAYVRKIHNLPIPSFKIVKELVQNKDLLEFISTPGAKNFWFE